MMLVRLSRTLISSLVRTDVSGDSLTQHSRVAVKSCAHVSSDSSHWVEETRVMTPPGCKAVSVLVQGVAASE